MASDEPLYCVICGQEDCGHDFEANPPPRAARYCHVDGVIPAIGKECRF